MPERQTRQTEDQAGLGGKRVHVNAATLVGRPAVILAATEKLFAEPTKKGAVEGPRDEVVRPLRGRFAHVPYSSEDLIREKREEAELEDRSS